MRRNIINSVSTFDVRLAIVAMIVMYPCIMILCYVGALLRPNLLWFLEDQSIALRSDIYDVKIVRDLGQLTVSAFWLPPPHTYIVVTEVRPQYASEVKNALTAFPHAQQVNYITAPSFFGVVQGTYGVAENGTTFKQGLVEVPTLKRKVSLPYEPRWARFLVASIAVGGGTLVASSAIRMAVGKLRQRRSRCPNCTYSVVGIVNRCPECGTEFLS